jgi:hypothetical protein
MFARAVQDRMAGVGNAFASYTLPVVSWRRPLGQVKDSTWWSPGIGAYQQQALIIFIGKCSDILICFWLCIALGSAHEVCVCTDQ